jgi:hypothetical protein
MADRWRARAKMGPDPLGFPKPKGSGGRRAAGRGQAGDPDLQSACGGLAAGVLVDKTALQVTVTESLLVLYEPRAPLIGDNMATFSHWHMPGIAATLLEMDH